jgi:ABC-type transporter Mla subunit MlaD
MSSEPRYFKLGVFVLLSVAIAVAAIVMLGAGRLFIKKFHVESYVDESVQGLDVGAPVKFRGVRIGELERIDFVATHYGLLDGRIRLIMGFPLESFPRVARGSAYEVCEQLSADGMRVRLASAGLTGGSYLELDLLDPKENPPPKLSWTPDLAYLPSVASTTKRLTDSLENILEQVGNMRLDRVSEKLSSLLDSVDKLMKSIEPALAEVKNVAASSDALVKDTRRVITGEIAAEVKSLVVQTRELIEKDVSPMVRSVRASTDRLPTSLEKVDGTLDRVSGTLRRLDRTLSEDSGSIDETLDNLRVVTQDLRDLTGQLKRNPSQALFSEPPPKKTVNK